MPFDNNSQLPKSLSALPSEAQSMFRKVVNQQMEKGNSETTAFKVAWSVVKKRFKQKDGKWVARSSDFMDTQYYTFDATPAEQFVERSEDGHIIHNYILTDLFPDSFGTRPSEKMLKQWADWLNEHQPEVDTDHEMFRTMKTQYGGNVGMVERAMQFKKGIAKTVKAFVDKGKLVVSLMFDKRYDKYVEKVKGLSVEAAVTKNDKNEWVDGKLFGFSAMINERPSNARSRRV